MSKFFSLSIMGTVILLIILTLSACIKTKDIRGYTFDQDDLATVKPGISTADDVRKALGSPSSVSSFGEETWYYISSKSEYVAFLPPETTDQTVVSITFSKDSLVKELKTYTKDDIKEVDFAKGKTRTAGNDEGIAEQLLGNIGRFNPSAEGVGPTIHNPNIPGR